MCFSVLFFPSLQPFYETISLCFYCQFVLYRDVYECTYMRILCGYEFKSIFTTWNHMHNFEYGMCVCVGWTGHIMSKLYMCFVVLLLYVGSNNMTETVALISHVYDGITKLSLYWNVFEKGFMRNSIFVVINSNIPIFVLICVRKMIRRYSFS